MTRHNKQGQIDFVDLEDAKQYCKARGAIKMGYDEIEGFGVYTFFNRTNDEVGHYYPAFTDTRGIYNGHVFEPVRKVHHTLLPCKTEAI